ncbi:hypothetical protein ASF56_09815 [Methylobacterium sp. Leaf122]|nr:hypothetical protein [Methylobacterium sp. Leaf122]KQQ04712.1 hypothetical protein ASF56_09815 [Methylobacterium sp. Leaf122]
MIRSEPCNPLLSVSVNLPLDLVLWLDGLVEASHDADDPESRSGVVRMMLRLAQAELKQDYEADSP